jgi:hypothetical protein
MLRTALLCVLLLGQSTAPPAPTRLGDVARQFADADMAGISRAAADLGSAPWLVAADPSQLAGQTNVVVFLSPQTTTPRMRRGMGLNLERRKLEAVTPAASQRLPAANDWIMRGTVNWAQVKVGDREFTAIEGDQDLNRPFIVRGRFSTAELLGIVSLIRTSPPAPADAPAADPAVRGEWPIESMSREVDGFDVRLRRDYQSWQRVLVRADGDTFTVASASMLYRD